MGECCRLLLLSTLSLLLCLPMCYGKCSISTDETPRTSGERGVTEHTARAGATKSTIRTTKSFTLCRRPSPLQPFAHIPLAYPALTYANCIGGFELRLRFRFGFGFCMQIIGRGLCSMLQFVLTGRSSDWATEAED